MTAAADLSSGETRSPRPTVLAWDLPTRLFKWSLVACVIAAWLTNRYAVQQPYLHVWNGYAVLILLVFRLFWGFVGGTTSRFSAFLAWPWEALRFLLAQLRGRGRAYLGHSPASGQMIAMLLVCLLAQASLGLFSADPDRLVVEGPLAATVGEATVARLSSLHRYGFDIIAALATIHVFVNVSYAAFTRKGFLTAMITGRKATSAYVDEAEARPGSLVAAAACLLCSIVVVFGGIYAFGGRFVS